MAKAKALGPSTLRGSKKAKQSLVVILEALSGECGTSEGAERLGISLSRYYQLETRALQGMLTALEPRPRGPTKSPDGEIRALKAELKGLQRELRRQQSLLRAASRSVGLKAAKKKKSRMRRGVRGAVVLKTLKEDVTKEEMVDGASKRHVEAAAGDRSQ